MWQWLPSEQQNLKNLKSNQSNTTKHATQKIFNYYSSQKAPKSSHHPMIETLTLNSEEFKSMWTWSKWYLISLTWTWKITVNAKKNEPEYYNPTPKGTRPNKTNLPLYIHTYVKLAPISSVTCVISSNVNSKIFVDFLFNFQWHKLFTIQFLQHFRFKKYKITCIKWYSLSNFQQYQGNDPIFLKISVDFNEFLMKILFNIE